MDKKQKELSKGVDLPINVRQRILNFLSLVKVTAVTIIAYITGEGFFNVLRFFYVARQFSYISQLVQVTQYVKEVIEHSDVTEYTPM